jgi:hypothetical protein
MSGNDRGIDYYKGNSREAAHYQRRELVKIEGVNFQKHIGDLLENGNSDEYMSPIQLNGHLDKSGWK